MDHLDTSDSALETADSAIELAFEITISILHVEDDETIATLAKEILEEQGWQINSCDDGDAAVEHLAGQVHYDFLLVDYDLPGINGLEIIRRARTLVHRSRTPVGVLSAAPVEAEAREAGANLFLRKPQDIGLLAESISKLLGEPRQ